MKIMSATMNEFEQLLMEEEKSLKSIKTGDTVEGVVFDVKPDEIILNIGSKSDGILTRNEYTNEPGVDFTIEVERPKSLGGGSMTTFLTFDQFVFLNYA